MLRLPQPRLRTLCSYVPEMLVKGTTLEGREVKGNIGETRPLTDVQSVLFEMLLSYGDIARVWRREGDILEYLLM